MVQEFREADTIHLVEFQPRACLEGLGMRVEAFPTPALGEEEADSEAAWSGEFQATKKLSCCYLPFVLT